MSTPSESALEKRASRGLNRAAGELLEIFRCQIQSRHLDLQAREMRARNEGFYTIGSSGHEANAAVGYLCRATDPAFLHHRSGGFMMARVTGEDTYIPLGPAADTVLASEAGIEAALTQLLQG